MILNTNKIINRNDFLCLLFLVLATCSVMGQAKQKKLLTPADYHLWSNLESPSISEKGNWVGYHLRYASGVDTLFVKSTKIEKTYSYPLCTSGTFCGERWFAGKLDNGTLKLTNLEKGIHEFFEDLLDYEFSGNGKYLFLLSKANEGSSTIIVIDLSNGKKSYVENATCWRFNKAKNSMAYCLQTGEAFIMAIGTSVAPVSSLRFQDAIGTNILWQDNDASLLFVTQTIDTSGRLDVLKTGLALYRFVDKRLLTLQPKEAKGFSKDKHIEGANIGTLKISDDGKRIFFSEVPDVVANPYTNPLVEVWQGDDKMLYSERQQFDPLDAWAKTAVWYPDTNEVFEFMPNETHVKLSGEQHYALTSSIEPCELQFKYSPDRDYYITNLLTRERQLFLHCHSPELQHTLMSPTGKYIVYYKDGNWYAYAIATGQHKNLTAGLGTAFYDESNDIGDEPDAYGFAGFTKDDNSIVIYDKYDVWEVTLDAISAKRITRGREKDIIFRIVNTNSDRQPSFVGANMSETIDLDSQLILKSTLSDNSMQGYYILRHGLEKKLIFASNRIYEVKKASKTNNYIFLKEDYEHPTSIELIGDKRIKTVFQSNPQQSTFKWGKVTTVNYLSEAGKPLKALLYYPTDYKEGISYPMITYIYQTQSDRLHYYRNPADPIYNGYSVPNFVNRGYFVLMPDIEYKMGSPGDSAVFCVTAAVNEALKRGDVSSNQVGLIGHSFGGYETSYIITKSNLFAAAVAGASLTDLVSEYLTVSENYKKAEIWRYEYYTNRMIKPLFENFKGYLDNSPLYNAPGIRTPLLLWAGEKDRHIASNQSMELYLAMRRLGKEVTMLRYPNEDHSLENPDKQLDLLNKVVDWFDYYLKNGQLKQWMRN